MSDEWSFMQSALRGDFGWIVCLTAWQTILRVVMVFFTNKLQEFMEQSVPQDKEWVQNLLDSRTYRVVTFFVKMLLTVKLPAVARKVSGGTEMISKAKDFPPKEAVETKTIT